MDTHSFESYFNLYDKGAYKEAYVVLRNIMESQPRWSKVGETYVWCANLELLVNNDLHEAQQLLNKAYKLGCSDMVDYYRIRGYILWKTGKQDKGLQNVEKSIELDARVSNLTTFGCMLSSINNKRAMDIWHQVLEKDPKNCLAHIYLGRESAKYGNWGETLLMAKRAERLNPSVDNIFEIGRLYHDAEEFQSALNSYFEANHRGYGNKVLLYACIAACYLSLHQASSARKYAQWAIQCNPEDDYAKEVWQKYRERYEK